jgi:Domain of unknown function (DUF4157)
MTSEREQSHAQANQDVAIDRDDAGIGRISRSAQLDAPASPVVSGLLSRKAERDGNGVADGAEAAVATASSSAGSSLPGTLMRKFEQSLGTDLSSVRVHTGGASETAASSVGAKAYAMGQDIHFGAGHYDPSSTSGQHLIAHEVAHTVQQRGGATRQNKLEVSGPQDAHEHEADRAADAMVVGAPAQVAGIGGGVHRAPTTIKPVEVEGATENERESHAKPFKYDVSNGAGLEAINAPWGGKPIFSAHASLNGTNMQDAFRSAWADTQKSWNQAVPLVAKFMTSQTEAEAKGVADFGKQPGNLDHSADDAQFTTHTKVSDAFDASGGVLKPGANSFDGKSVSKELKEQIANAKTDLAAADLQVNTAGNNISNQQLELKKQSSMLTSAAANLERLETTQGIEAQDRTAAAYVKSAAIINQALGAAGGTLAPGKSFEDQAMSGAVGVAGMINTLAWDAALMQVQGEIERLKGQITSIDKANLRRAIDQQVATLLQAKTTLANTLTAYNQATNIRAQKFRLLGPLLEKAGAQSGLNPKDAEKVSLAVQAKPMMELALSSARELDAALGHTALPAPSEDSELGCSIASNRDEFAEHYATLKSAKTLTPKLVAKWTARLASSNALVNAAH